MKALHREGCDNADSVRPWLKKLGVAGFLFFFLKGTMWLSAPVLLALFGFSG